MKMPLFSDLCERPLNSVKNLVQNAGGECDGNRGAAAVNRHSGTQPAGLFIDLNGGAASLQAYDLPDQPIGPTYTIS